MSLLLGDSATRRRLQCPAQCLSQPTPLPLQLGITCMSIGNDALSYQNDEAAKCKSKEGCMAQFLNIPTTHRSETWAIEMQWVRFLFPMRSVSDIYVPDCFQCGII